MKINLTILMYVLGIYIFSIIMFDYTIFYKIILVIMFLLTLLLCRKKVFKLNQLMYVYGIFIVYFLLHTALGFSINTDISYRTIFTSIINFLSIFSITQIIKDKKSIEFSMKAVIVSAIIIVIYVCLFDYNNFFSGYLGSGVLKPFTNMAYSHNDIPIVVAFAIMFLSYFEINNKQKRKTTKLLKYVFLIYIVLTGARKSLLLAIIGMWIYPTIVENSTSKNVLKNIMKVYALLVLIILFCVAIMKIEMLYNVIGYRFEGYFVGIFNGEYKESSASTRNVMKTSIISLIKENPILGYGIDTFQFQKGSYNTWSHNNYLELLYSGGIVALLIFYYIYFYFVVTFIKKKKTSLDWLCICILLFMFIHDYLSVCYNSRIILLILTIINSCIKINKDEDIKDEEKNIIYHK